MFDFSDWLAGVEEPAEAVTIFQKPGLVARIAKLEEALPKADPNQERALGDRDPRAELQKLRDELAASRTVWYLSPISREDERVITKAIPEPKAPCVFEQEPPRLVDRATETQSRAFIEAWEAFKQARKQWEDANAETLADYRAQLEDVALARGAARLARSVTYIETADGERQRVELTGDDILALEKKLGQPQIGVLVEALGRVSTEVPEEPDPFDSPEN